MDYKVGIGVSQENDSRAAAKAAVSMALEKGGVSEPQMLLVFATARYDQAGLMAGLTEVSQVPMIGGTTAGSVWNDGYVHDSVMVVALQTPGIQYSFGVGQGATEDVAKASQAAAKMALDNCQNPEQKKTWLMFKDGLRGDGTMAIAGAQQVLGSEVEIVGLATADEGEFKTSWVYCHGQAYENAVAGVLMSGDFITSSVLRSGWAPVGNSIKASSEQTFLMRLNGKPALDLYKKYLGQERSVKLPQISWEYPLGIVVPAKDSLSMQTLTRPALSQDDQSKSLRLTTGFAKEEHVYLTAGSRNDLLQETENAAKQSQAGLEGARTLLALYISCWSRKMVLGRRGNEELSMVKQTLGDQIPIAGGFSYGQIGSYGARDDVRFYNQNVLLWLLGTRQY